MITKPWFWKMCYAIIISVILWDVVISCSTSLASGECKQGWFGSSCQYRCRCESYQCTVNGLCQPGYKCQGGWFGPECQYIDLAYNTSRLYTDGNDRTCITDSTKYITVPLNNTFPSYRITWLRLVLLEPWTENVSNSLFIEFKIRNETFRCINARNSTVDKQTLDVYCDLPDTVHSVTLQGSAVSYLCSVYVSGGRNVALGQNTSSSGDVPVAFSCAVDADAKNTWGASCARMHTDANFLTWTLTLLTPIHADRFIIYKYGYFGYNFTVDYFTPENTKVFVYSNSSDFISCFVLTNVTSPVSSVVIMFENIRWRRNIVTLCEMEVFGDTFCPKQSYGRECEHKCNCKNYSECFVSTGGCPAGCAEGYQGESCSEFQQEHISPTKEETTSTTCTIPFVVIGVMTLVVVLLIIVIMYLRWRGTVQADISTPKHGMQLLGTNKKKTKRTEPKTSSSVQVSNPQQPINIESKNERETATHLDDSTNVYEIITANIYCNVDTQ